MTGPGRTIDRPIATLGPTGTDAESEAARWADEVVLCGSFQEAMNTATRRNYYALVAAGYLHQQGDVIVDTWVDLHFRSSSSMSVVAAWASDTRPMCLAINRGAATPPKTVAVHPATRYFAGRLVPSAEVVPVISKPRALEMARAGKVDSCLSSADMAQECDELRIEQTFYPTMIWVLYEVADA